MVILQSMERIINERLDVIDKELAEDMVKQASEELTQSKVACHVTLSLYWDC